MPTQRLFRFGVVSHGPASRGEWYSQARKAEHLGYATFLVNDHLHSTFAPVPAIIAAAEATTTLRVESYVFANNFRHPVVLAKEAATIDVLSKGRFEFGIGSVDQIIEGLQAHRERYTCSYFVIHEAVP